MKVCLILCFLNALTSSKKKFAQTYGKNRDINHDLCPNLSLSPIQTLQMGRRDHPSFAGGQPSTGTAGQNTIPFARYRSLQYRTIIGRRATSRLHKPKGHFCYLEMPSGSVPTSLSAPSYTCLRVVLLGCHYLECQNPLHLQA